jgi:hypothetical protein
MMNRYRVLALAVVAALLTIGASTVQAAKGVKKGGTHKVHGTLVALRQAPQGLLLTVQVHHHAKGRAAAKAVHQAANHTFVLTQGTQVMLVQGKLHQPGNAAALRQGAHVAVVAKGNQASLVEVHLHAAKPRRR